MQTKKFIKRLTHFWRGEDEGKINQNLAPPTLHYHSVSDVFNKLLYFLLLQIFLYLLHALNDIFDSSNKWQ